MSRPQSSETASGGGGTAAVPEVDAREALVSQEAGAVLLDVREDDEVAAGHAPGIVHVRLGELADRLDDVPRDTRVLVICRSGARSARAAAFLNSRGYDAVNVAGGMRAWARAGQTVRGAGGGDGRVI